MLKSAGCCFPKTFKLLLRNTISPIITVAGFPIVLFLYLNHVRLLVNCRSMGIGHLSLEPAWFHVKRMLYDSSLNGAKYFIFGFEEGMANRYLSKLFSKYSIFCFKSRVINFVLHSFSKWSFISIDIGLSPPRGNIHDKEFCLDMNIRQAKMIKDLQMYRKKVKGPFFNLDAEAIRLGKEATDCMGIKEGQWFVCLHAGEISTDGKYGYDLPRRQELRDYYEMTEYIVNSGGKVVRMGDKNLPMVPEGMRVINYPHSEFKSDWMDIYLIWKCKYFVGCSSGLAGVATLFRKPLILTNILAWHQAAGFDGDIFLPKLIKLKEHNGYLSIRDFLNNELFVFNHNEESGNFDYLPNLGEDLILAVEELQKYLTTGLQEPINEIQERWRNSLICGGLKEPSGARISSSFASRYEKILFS